MTKTRKELRSKKEGRKERGKDAGRKRKWKMWEETEMRKRRVENKERSKNDGG
jgi:hypothetical protein